MAEQELFGPLARAMVEAYGRGEDDESLEPLVLVDGAGQSQGLIRSGDPVIFADLRGEREREIVQALTEPGFDKFPRPSGFSVDMATLVDYGPDLRARPAFEGLKVARSLSRVVAEAGLKQLKVVETEKAIHLTYFFNGKHEEPLPGEERLFIETEKGPGFAQKPEMRAAEVAETAAARLSGGEYALVTVNLANVDVVNHVEEEAPVVKAVEVVDEQAGRLVEAGLRSGCWVIVTADHGSAERWYYPDGRPDTGHTDSPVPFILLGPEKLALRAGGDLTDVAPSVLGLLGLEAPAEMTGRPLFEGRPQPGRVLLLILDGWGLREESYGNLILKARTPNLDRLLAEWPATSLVASGTRVGMPQGTVGNSETGHLHLGAGLRLDSDRVRIDKAIADGSFYENPAFLDQALKAKREGRPLHILSILSFYSSHGSLDHLLAVIELARRQGAAPVYLQAMLGRRGERHQSGPTYLSLVEKHLTEQSLGRVATVIGRHWSLDREGNWDRIEKTFNLYVRGRGRPVADE